MQNLLVEYINKLGDHRVILKIYGEVFLVWTKVEQNDN